MRNLVVGFIAAVVGRRSLVSIAASVLGALLATSAAVISFAAPRSDGQLEIEIVDKDTGQPIAARIHLKSTRGRPVTLRPPGSAAYGDHFYADGRVTLPLPVGQYTMEIEATPEYRTINSQPFEIQRHADDSKRVEIPRFADLAAEGWWAGDLDVSRPPAELPLAMRAEGLNFVAVNSSATPPNASGRKPTQQVVDNPAAAHSNDRVFVDTSAILDQRAGGGLLVFDAHPSLDFKLATSSVPTSLTVLREAAQAGGHVVARTPFAWDLPVWLASGELDAIALIQHHSRRNDVDDQEDDGRPRDKSLFPGNKGNGRWSEAIYYHVLNCGLRIPPAAGSGSGTNGSPLGNNRVYVYCGDEFSAERWWEGLIAGRVFVTNGPLLRPIVEGRPPGHVFSLRPGEKLALEIGLELATRVPIEYLQIVKNGQVEAEVRLADWKGKIGRLPPVVFDDSGWFLVRAVTANRQIYQFASSGPYYVDSERHRISRRSVQFFLDWIDEAVDRVRKLADIDESERTALLAEQEMAREFFKDLAARANAD